MSDWTPDELEVIREIATADEVGLVPNDRWLPTYEALRAKGVLMKTMFSGEPVYTASECFRAEVAAWVHRSEAARAATWN